MSAMCEVRPPQPCEYYDTIRIYVYDTIYIYDTIPKPVVEIDSFTRDAHYTGLQYIGSWTKMNNATTGQRGAFANKSTDTLRYVAYGFKYQIHTEKMDHHAAYKVFVNKKLIKSVNVQSPTTICDEKTFEIELPSGNNIIELVPDGGYFVFNSFTVTFYVKPTWQ
jgi:hypothetical protein